MDNEQLHDAWAAWLNRREWHYFLTITFRYPRQPHLAISTIREVGKLLRASTKGNYFIGTELHQNRTLHVHGLLQAPYGPNRPQSRRIADQIWRDCLERFGRSEVRRVRKNEAVTSYVSKYVTKGFTEWELQLQ